VRLTPVLVAGGLAVGALALALAPRSPDVRVAQAPAIAAYPLPGTRTASTRTQISLRGAPISQLGAITVTGSRSGRHAGTLRAHSDGEGASFVLSKPLSPGERVTVRTALDIAGAHDGDYTFTVGRRPPPHPTRPAEPSNVGRGAVSRYVTRPDLAPPAVEVTTREPGRAPGLVFVAPKGGRGQDGPMILDDAGHVVWFKPAGNREEATDFRVQTLFGRPVLTWWQGRLIGGEGRGEGVIYDDRYRPVQRVRAGNGYQADLHEFTITPQGTALLAIYDPVRQDLRSVGGSRHGIATEAVVQEIDIKTGLVLFEWHSIGNIALSESYEPVPKGSGQWDYVHLNSIALDADGDFILSARHTSSVLALDRATGRIAWRLGGKRSSFRLGDGAGFDFQHDARPQPDGTLTIYDNSTKTSRGNQSRGITLRLDEQRRTATLVKALTHPRRLLSATQGSVQALPGGGTFIGFGSQRWFSGYDAGGRLVFDAHLARGNDTYRAYRLPWTGRPVSPPRIVARRGSGAGMTVRASWNGATGVARWQLLAGSSRGALAVVSTKDSEGFETAISAPRAPYVAMRALDAQGTPLATSPTVSPR
jgi:Arylsulfotransferase (ASST)